MPNWGCPKCHTANPGDEQTCRTCGTRRPHDWDRGTWTCPQCGRKNANNERYCPACGTFAGLAGDPAPAFRSSSRSWECSVDHSAQRAENAICDVCKKGQRPSGWLDRTWTCPECGGETPNRQNYCDKCGHQYYSQAAPAPEGVPDVRGMTAGLLDSLRKQQQEIVTGARQEVQSALDAARRGLDVPAGRAAAPPANKAPSFARAPGIALPGRTPGAPPMPGGVTRPASPAFARVTTRHLDVVGHVLPKVNYALLHAGLPLIPKLQVTNSANEPANDVLLKAWLATDYGEPWQKSVASIPAGATHTETGIHVPLSKARLQQVREAEKTSLRLDVACEGSVEYSDTWPMEVLAYNEWYYHPAIPQTLACFVQPNSPAIERVVSLVRDRLVRERRATDLSGYQSGDPDKVVMMVEALYGVLQQDLALSYINPPPSFETPEPIAGGGFTLSQKVFFPEQILEHRRGTCLDLALFAAACVERMGLNPLLFLVHGHAFFGLWLVDKVLEAPVLRDRRTVQQLSEGRAWLPLNSTTFASSEHKPFDACVKEAAFILGKPEIFECAVDVAAARRTGIKPIPPLV
jgi:hypothetical protein